MVALRYLGALGCSFCGGGLERRNRRCEFRLTGGRRKAAESDEVLFIPAKTGRLERMAIVPGADCVLCADFLKKGLAKSLEFPGFAENWVGQSAADGNDSRYPAWKLIIRVPRQIVHERLPMRSSRFRFRELTLAAAVALAGSTAVAQDGGPPPEYPPVAKVLEGFEKVVTKANINPMYTLYTRAKDGQMYAELPRDFQMRKYFIATTVASGEDYAGLQAGDLYVYWRKYDKHLALIAPNIEIRASGEREAEASVKRLFTDKVIMEVPIITMGPNGGPVIDVDQMLLTPDPRFNIGPAQFNPSLTQRGIFSIRTAKAFGSVSSTLPWFSICLSAAGFSRTDFTAS